VAVLAGGAVVGVARIRRRSPRPAAPSRPPEEIARERINRLRGVVPGDDAALKEYYSDISFLVREYIEGKLSLPALECTTAELLGRLAGVEGKERWISALERLLLEADLVKFAKHRPALDQGRRALADAEEVVEVIARQQAALRSPMEGSHLKAESASGKLEGSPG
jgi:hypothetical protein